MRPLQRSDYTIIVGNRGDTDTHDVIVVLKLPLEVSEYKVNLSGPDIASVDWNTVPQGTIVDGKRFIAIWVPSLSKFEQQFFTLKVRAPINTGQISIEAEVWHSEFTGYAESGDMNFIAESSIFAALVYDYHDALISDPDLFSDAVADYATALRTWMEGNNDDLIMMPICYLEAAAINGALNSNIDATNSAALCDKTAMGLNDYFENFGGASDSLVHNDFLTIGMAFADDAPPGPQPGYGQPVPGGCQGQGFGHPRPGYPNGHGGSDIFPGPSGDKSVKAITGGRVTHAGWGNEGHPGDQEYNKRGGYSVRITDDNGVSWHYDHLEDGSAIVKRGDRVAVGADLGTLDKTGFKPGSPTSAHAHIERWPNPSDPDSKTDANAYMGYGQCPTHPKPPAPKVKDSKEKKVDIAGAIDPNEKVGPVGHGNQGFIQTGVEHNYVIFFENLASATAPAEDIVITDQLDSDLDWNTLSFLGSSHPDFLQVQFDSGVGRITWTFNNINLPPNQDPPEGEGWVMFSISQKTSLASGTEIRNRASIVFDFNPAIQTNEVLNTIDTLPPSSSITPLNAVQTSTSFLVSWTGGDGSGSGIRGYNIYVSEDNSGFTPIFMDITDNSAMFTGQPGHTYSFYSVATDNVGNDEAPPAQADTSTTIQVEQNHSPVAFDDVMTTLEDTQVDIPVLANDTDADGDVLTLHSVGTATNGTTVKNPDGTVTYIPDPNFNGHDSFNYKTIDPDGANSTALVSITVRPVNDPPNAENDRAATDQGEPVLIRVLDNDTDLADNDVLSIQTVSTPNNGAAIDNGDGTISYTPNSGFSGSDKFNYTITDAGGATDEATVFVTVAQVVVPDNDPPTVEGTPDRAPDSNDWYNHTAVITWIGDDGPDGTGISECDPATTYSGPDGSALVIEGHCTDNAGNTGTGSITINFDQTAPSIDSFEGSISDGEQFIFGSVPSNDMSCSASDVTSGIDGECEIAGYSTAVGTHTLVATARDLAGNSASQTIQYTVAGWTIKGFYTPVDMNGIVNTVKNGLSVPFKFEIFAGTTELTSTGTEVIKSVIQKKISCSTFAGDPTDSLEETLSSRTSLVYDPNQGQYVRVWQTPKSPNTCWEITLTTADDSFIKAYFRLR